jgi:3-oxoacyl-[acyl-carrier protein] reductase
MTKRTLSMEEYDSLKKFFVRLEDVFNICHLLCFNNTSITGKDHILIEGIYRQKSGVCFL